MGPPPGRGSYSLRRRTGTQPEWHDPAIRSRGEKGEFVRNLLLAALVLACLCGCSIRHEITRDYPQYLVDNQGESHLPSTEAASSYLIAPATAAHHYEFRSAMVGYANLWIVDFGKLLDQTLRSQDVQAAFGGLTAAADPAGKGTLVFELQNYSFTDLGAHVWMKVTLRRNGEDVFEKVYMVDGETQGAKMFWGGVFAMKNAIQSSTKVALDEIFRQLILDLNNFEKVA
jgi:hypothetical protein